jgi:hypothetical protein
MPYSKPTIAAETLIASGIYLLVTTTSQGALEAKGQYPPDSFRSRAEAIFVKPTVLADSDSFLFAKLAAQWKRETGHYSTVRQKISHPSFLKILTMRERAIPSLIKEIQTSPGHWFLALRLITDANPVREGSSKAEAVEAWTKWWGDRRITYV